MKRFLIPLLVIVLLLLWGVFWVGGPEAEWTTGSAAALAEFESCLDAHMKFYYQEAARHCEAAIDLDPDFASARLMSLNFVRGDRRAERIEALRQTDLEPLNETERFLIRYRLARADRKLDEAERILRERLEEAPDDAFAVDAECNIAWYEQDWTTAESCYQRLLEIDPNWAIAQNHLGYIAMARGEFEEAEEQFETYRFIAPDQANPHDSMGELLTLVGRYEEAREELDAALAIRPDFCSSYRHLISLQLLAREFDGARETAARALEQPECGSEMAGQLGCGIDAWEGMVERDWEHVLEVVGRPECASTQAGDVQIIAHAALSSVGRTEDALAIERQFQKLLEEGHVRGKERDIVEALSYHLWGARLAAEGDLDGAAKRYRQADETLVYWNDSGLGVFKLFNQLSLASALSQSGNQQEAADVLERIQRVNSRFVEDFSG